MYANIRHMKRTTIYLEPELEVLLKLEVLRQKRPMAELVREALHAYVTREPSACPLALGRSQAATATRPSAPRSCWARPGSAASSRPAPARRPPHTRPPRREPAVPTVSILLDTGIVYAYYDRGDAWHTRARAVHRRGRVGPHPAGAGHSGGRLPARPPPGRPESGRRCTPGSPRATISSRTCRATGTLASRRSIGSSPIWDSGSSMPLSWRSLKRSGLQADRHRRPASFRAPRVALKLELLP